MPKVNQTERERVAIVGGGPSGLAVARFLKQYGFDPVIFEQSDGIGGQWNAGAAHSGVWPTMCTNSSRVTTCFSDFGYGPGTPLFPGHRHVLTYLRQRLIPLCPHSQDMVEYHCCPVNKRIDSIG